MKSFRFEMVVLLPALVAASLSLVLTPCIIALATKKGWFDDQNNPRKIHTGAIPRLGGIAIFISFFVAMCLMLAIGLGGSKARMIPVGVAGISIFILGLVDDFRGLRARFKFGLQLIGAIVVAVAGYRFQIIPLPGGSLDIGVFSWPLTILWIVGISNAINMIDGMDGLAGGISLIAAGSFGVLYLALGEISSAAVGLGLAGAIVGFLFYNMPKARVFMGDAGSLFLGFTLAVLPLIGVDAHPREFGVLPAATILAVPIFDVFAAIIRRTKRRAHVMSPDREHLHHKLLDLGLETRLILTMIYLVCLGLGTAVVVSAGLSDGLGFALLLVTLALLAIGFVVLHFIKEGAKKKER